MQAIVYRNNLNKTIQFAGQYDAIRQGESFPVSLSAIGSIEGTNNFRSGHSDDEGEDDEHDHGVANGHRSPALGGVVSRTFSDRLAVYAVPMWVHHVIPDPPRDTFYIGVGGRGRISRNVYVVGEVSPRVNGFAAGDLEYAFGIERRAGGHMFQLTFTNSLGSTYGQIGAGRHSRHDLSWIQPGSKVLLSDRAEDRSMKKLAFLPMLLLVFAAGCEDDPPTDPTPLTPTFTMPLLSSNEPVASDASEACAAGNVTIRFNVTRDSAQAITAATADFQANITSCPDEHDRHGSRIFIEERRSQRRHRGQHGL